MVELALKKIRHKQGYQSVNGTKEVEGQENLTDYFILEKDVEWRNKNAITKKSMLFFLGAWIHAERSAKTNFPPIKEPKSMKVTGILCFRKESCGLIVILLSSP